MGKKLDYEYVETQIEKEGYKLLSDYYKNAQTKLEIQCNEGHTYKVAWNTFQQGHRCPYCAGNGRLTYKYVKNYIEKEGYKLLSTNYKNSTTKLKVQCPNKHIYEVSWLKFYTNRRCSKCNSGNLGANVKLTTAFIKNEFKKENYILLTKSYINAHAKLWYICKDGHINSITWNDWNSGYRCRDCQYNKARLVGGNEATKNQVYRSYVSNAFRRNYKFELNREEFIHITSKNCYYCGTKPTNKQSGLNNNGDYIYNGIDRVDNKLGYTISNCVPCCKICNRAKSNLSYNKFIRWIENVVRFNS